MTNKIDLVRCFPIIFPEFAMSAASVCSCSLFLLTATIVNPSFANLLATAWPIPGPAPAIKQTARPVVIIFTELYVGILPMYLM